MATVTGLTAQRMLEIEAMSIVAGGIDLATGRLKLERHDGGIIDAGNVRGVGLTPGGDTGTALFKKSPNDYDTEWLPVTINASQVTNGVFHPARMAHILSDSTGRTWFTTNTSGTWGGDHTLLAISPPTDAAWTNALELRVNNAPKFAIDKDGVLSAGTVPAERLSGRVGSGNLAHIASSQSSNPPYVILGVQPDLGYDTATTALHLANFSGTTQGLRCRIYDSARKLLFQLNRDSAGDYAAAPAFYTRTTTAAANVAVGSSGELHRSTSLRDAKRAIEDAPESWVERVWSLRPRTWFDRGDADLLADALDRQANGEEIEWDEVLAAPLRRIPGFVAEEVEEAGLEEFLIRDETGALTGLAYDRFSAALLVAMKDEREKRLAAEARLDILEARLVALEESATTTTPEETEPSE